ncbi:CHAT domain-containing protein [Streptomyces sp. 1222.2]|uniref:CHAT domain-containing protein n=1 Tax=Streptomyces sp. 1222.2 TaxID=1938833 RepID=UPI00117F70AB|nr:CHAT domain-containing protein [Streptomyces sp. 1222.2]
MNDGESPATLLTAQARWEAAELAEEGDPGEDLPVAHLLGMFHWYRYLVLPSNEDQEALDAAVRFLYPVYRARPEAVPDALRAMFAGAGTSSARHVASVESAAATAGRLFGAYQQSRRLPQLEQAIALMRDAVAGTPQDDLAHPGLLSNLALLLRAQSEHTDDIGPLAEAVELGRRAAATTSDDHAKYLTMLGLALRALFERTDDVAALAEAAEVGRRAVVAAPAGHPDHRSCLSNLSITLRFQASRMRDIALLTDAVKASRQAVTGGHRGVPERVAHLANLAIALQETFQHAGDAALLAEAVPVCSEAVTLAPHGHPHHTDVLRALSAVLESLSERPGPAGLLAEAVEVARRAVAALPAGHPRRAGLLNTLGAALQALFERRGETDLLAEAVEICREAVAATSDDDPYRAAYVVNLADALRMHSEQTGDIRLLAEAVEVGRRSIAVTPDESRRREMRLSNLSLALRTLARRTGDVGQLAQAVEAARQAVAVALDDSPYLPSYLSNLSLALQALSEQTGDTTTLAEAAEFGRRAVLASPTDHPHRAGHLSYLGIVLLALAKRAGNIELLIEAMDVSSQAVAALPEDHPDRAQYLNNLSAVLQAGTPEMRAWAVELSREAVATTPHDNPYCARRVSNLGAHLQELAEQTGDASLLAEAVELGHRAVAATPEDHPHHASFLSNLGQALKALAEPTQDTMLLAEALERFRSASRNTAAEPFVRVQALREVAVLVGSTPSGTAEALAAVETAVGLLPRISPRTLARDDQRHQVRRLGSLASVAAAAALEAGRPRRAVELLEATRGTLAAGTIAARSDDLTQLGEHHAGLAREFSDLRDRLDTLDNLAFDHVSALDAGPHRTDGTPGPAQGPGDIALARRLAHDEWERLVDRIRKVDGFSGFLNPPRLADLTGQGDQGPIVFLTAGPARCDALILGGTQPETVRTVRLHRLTAHDAAARVEQLANARRTATDRHQPPTTRKDAQHEILDILAWLWNTVAEPVLTAIGFTGTPADGAPLQRIWWCPVGVMCDLPVHAAGHHRDLTSPDPLLVAAPRTVLDRAISSYTPTARALKYARSHQPSATERALIIAVPDAPGTRPLSGAAFEADTINALMPDALRPDRPVRSDTLAALPTHPVAHFSCHGLADARDPAASRLILHDHETAPLTVKDISALRLTGALAFLSACDTSATSLQLVDEAVHLTGAFHLAGYQNVIGTLWPVNDRTAADLAADFYAHLTLDGTTYPDTAESARALHQAVHSLRARFLLAPTHWAAHTHTGP